ncbi:tyrosine-type recombinase/integrase [Thomasclavelia sp.]
MSIRRRVSKKARNGYVYEVYFTYKKNGVSTRYSKSGFATKKEAQEHESFKLAEVQKNGKLKRNMTKTLDEVYNEFLEVGTSRYQANTITNTKRNYKCHIKQKLGQVIIQKLDYELLQRFFNNLSSNTVTTNKNIKIAFNRILDFAVRVGYIDNNQLRFVTICGVIKKSNKYQIIADEQLELLLNELRLTDSFTNQAYVIAIEIGSYTGLRISEVFALEKDDIDLISNTINVNRKLIYNDLKKDELYSVHQLKSKSSNAIIPMPYSLKEILVDWFKTNPYQYLVCDIDGHYLHPKYFHQKITRLKAKCGVKFNFHMLRHSYATTLIMNNVDIKTAQELLRHSSFNTTLDVYTHISEKHKNDVVNNIFNSKSIKKVSKVYNYQKSLN